MPQLSLALLVGIFAVSHGAPRLSNAATRIEGKTKATASSVQISRSVFRTVIDESASAQLRAKEVCKTSKEVQACKDLIAGIDSLVASLQADTTKLTEGLKGTPTQAQLDALAAFAEAEAARLNTEVQTLGTKIGGSGPAIQQIQLQVSSSVKTLK